MTLLAPGVAARRLARGARASPSRATAMLAHMAWEKSVVFAQAWTGFAAAVATANLELSGRAMEAWFRTETNATQRTFETAMNAGEKIARAALAPVAGRVRRNARRR